MSQWTEDLSDAVAELEQKQTMLLRDLRVDPSDPVIWSAETVRITFLSQDEAPRASAELIQVGTAIPDERRWVWTWADDAAAPSQRAWAERLRELGEAARIEAITSATLALDERTPASALAVAARLLDAVGYYRVEVDEREFYFVLKSAAPAHEVPLPILDQVESGPPPTESLLVAPARTGSLRVLVSPGMLEGLAAGDIIELDASREEGFRVAARGGNVSVQFFAGHDDPVFRRALTERACQLGGRLDTHRTRLWVFTIPVRGDVTPITSLFDGMVGRLPSSTWMYGNVFARGSNEPLNWWKR
jgi:hypothetical protein